MKIGNLFAELKRRNVIRMAGLYLVGAWLLVQVAGTVLPMFGAPDWLPRSIVILLAIGFIPAIIFAWAFELTPSGLKRDEEVTPAESIAPQTARRMDRLIIAVLALALLYFGFDKFVLAPRREAAFIAFAQKHDASPTAAKPSAVINNKSIAVLPFENLSDDKNAAYFADGIQDEILTKLASVADLKVISRTSTAKYKSKPEDLKTVSQQLGVATVLEGTVQKAADKVRVNVQLIDARADSHLWAKTYDRDIKDVFAVESEVAQEIADALRAKLSPAEANTLATAPTKDTAAYDFFLKGEYEARLALSSFKAESFDQAADWYRQAITRDPNFALAMAQLVVCRMRRHWLAAEPLNESELLEIEKTARHALTLAPDLAEAHVALGVFHYYGFRQYEPALAEFRRAIELQPNNAEALQFVAYVHRRRGEWDRALAELGQSLEKDPRNASITANIAQTYCCLRRWQEAEKTARHALTMDPHEATGMGMLLLSCLNRDGDARDGLRVLTTFPADDLLLPNSGTLAMVIGRRAETFIQNRDFKSALQEWETRPNATAERQQLSAKTAIRFLAGDFGGAQADADKARLLLEARLREHPGEVRSMRALSWVYLGLNRKEDATKIARQALELLPPDKDAVLGSANMASLAEIQARTGATSDAVSILRRMLSIPAGEVVSVARLKVDPVWDPIRNDPGFQELLAVKELVGSGK